MQAGRHSLLFQFHKGTIKTCLSFCTAIMVRNFNSIKVQLKLSWASCKAFALAYFNSIKVQLKPISIHRPRLPRSHFNSIKVQLKPTISCTCLLLCIFQFHKGTIKTEGPSSECHRRSSFQFHKGTIKTLLQARAVDDVLYFNSIKVQLKPCAGLQDRGQFAISIP